MTSASNKWLRGVSEGAQSRDDGKFSGCFGYLKIFLLFAGLPASASLHNGFDPFPSARGRDHRHLAIAPPLPFQSAASLFVELETLSHPQAFHPKQVSRRRGGHNQ